MVILYSNAYINVCINVLKELCFFDFYALSEEAIGFFKRLMNSLKAKEIEPATFCQG